MKLEEQCKHDLVCKKCHELYTPKEADVNFTVAKAKSEWEKEHEEYIGECDACETEASYYYCQSCHDNLRSNAIKKAQQDLLDEIIEDMNNLETWLENQGDALLAWDKLKQRLKSKKERSC